VTVEGEFKPIEKITIESGIQSRMPCPYTFQQNGKAERKHIHVTEIGLTLLAQAKMPLHYWWKAFSTKVYLINRLPSSVNQNESPFSLLFEKKPDYDALKLFGCACYPCLKPYNQHKLQFHTTQCIFLGYNKSHKGYKCLNSHGRIFILRHMVFNENHFPFHNGFLDTRNSLKTLIGTIPIVLPSCSAGTTTSHTVESTHIKVNHQEGDLVSNEEQPTLGDLAANDDQPTLNDISIHANETTSHVNDTPEENNQQTQQDNTHWMQTRSKTRIFKPKLPYIGLLETNIEDKEPKNVNEVLLSPKWKTTMDAKFKALATNHTWILVPFQGQSGSLKLNRRQMTQLNEGKQNWLSKVFNKLWVLTMMKPLVQWSSPTR